MDDRIPNLQVKTYESGDIQIKSIEGTIKLSAWSGYRSSRNGNSNEETDGTVKISIGGDMVVDNPEVTEEHVAAYNYLLQHQDHIKGAILTALLKAYKDLQEQYDYDPENAALLMPNVTNVSQFKTLIRLSSVHLLHVSKEDTAYMGYEFGCKWDDEHGLGVMTHKDRVIEIGGADTSFLTWVAENDLNPEMDDNATLPEEKKIKNPWWKFW